LADWVFECKLKEEGLGRVKVKQDNNSMFRAVAVSLYGSENMHMEVRKTVTNFMIKNSDEFYRGGPEQFER